MMKPKHKTSRAQRKKHATAAQASDQRKRAQGLVRVGVWVPAADARDFKDRARASTEQHLAKRTLSRQPQSTMPGNTAPEKETQVAPSTFHDLSHRPVLIETARQIVAAEGPILSKRLTNRIARAQGFAKTGCTILETLSHVIDALGNKTAIGEHEWIIWPVGQDPVGVMSFRSLQIAGEKRTWKEVPLPEKLGLVRECAQTSPGGVPKAVAERLGYRRVTASFKLEIEDLEKRMAQMEKEA